MPTEWARRIEGRLLEHSGSPLRVRVPWEPDSWEPELWVRVPWVREPWESEPWVPESWVRG